MQMKSCFMESRLFVEEVIPNSGEGTILGTLERPTK